MENIQFVKEPIEPHTYPLAIKILLAFVSLLFIYSLLTVPKILSARTDMIRSYTYIRAADKQFEAGDFERAIPLYRKGLYLGLGKDPLRLALCYLNMHDSASLYNGLGLLPLMTLDSTRAIEVLKVLPERYREFIKSSQLTYKKKVISTSYSFDFAPLKKENIRQFEKISAAKEAFEDFINTNPNY